MKKLYIGTNTKMYKTIQQTCQFLSLLGERTEDISREQCEIFVIPSFTSLESAAKIAQEGNIKLGAQNMGWEDEGAFTRRSCRRFATATARYSISTDSTAETSISAPSAHGKEPNCQMFARR